jgi:hypothetical protein
MQYLSNLGYRHEGRTRIFIAQANVGGGGKIVSTAILAYQSTKRDDKKSMLCFLPFHLLLTSHSSLVLPLLLLPLLNQLYPSLGNSSVNFNAALTFILNNS